MGSYIWCFADRLGPENEKKRSGWSCSCTTAIYLSDIQRPGAPWGAEANYAGGVDLLDAVETLGLFQGAVKGEVFAQCGALLRDVWERYAVGR